ncbi:hypothetical protein [Actinoplanes utahensis]|uniref:hypothetical protein n=1 Tax=Actinoplanes utahensis TaxID=1869 RepID=UPI00126A487E|nr:hypothetical protein [Actinoplanes utahensis]
MRLRASPRQDQRPVAVFSLETTVLTLDRRGWQRQEPVRAGTHTGFDRDTGTGLVLSVHLDPGIVGQVGFSDKQHLVAVYLHDGSAGP